MDSRDTQSKSLYRSRTNRIIFGVCGGLGEYFDVDPIVFRIIFIALTLGGGFGIILYLALAFLMPKEPIQGQANSSGNLDIKERANALVSELKDLGSEQSNKKNFIAIAIIFFGALLLLDELLPENVFNWNIFWALIIIFLGAMLLKRQKLGFFHKIKEQSVPAQNTEGQGASTQDKTNREDSYRGKRIGIFRLFFGLLILIIGFGLLAQNLNIIPEFNLNFSALFKFWPIFIILAGLSLLSQRSWLGSILAVIFSFILILVFIGLLMSSGDNSQMHNSQFEIKKEGSATRAELIIETGASKVNIRGGAAELASGNLESNFTTLKTDSRLVDGLQKAFIKLDGNVRSFHGVVKSDLTLNLNDSVPLSLDVHSGASSLNMDVSSLLLEELKLDTGASKSKIIFGDKVDAAKAEISAGVSSIELILPESLGVRLEIDSALSGKQFADLKQIDGKNYESENYAGAEKKIGIKINAGVSNIIITRQ